MKRAPVQPPLGAVAPEVSLIRTGAGRGPVPPTAAWGRFRERVRNTPLLPGGLSPADRAEMKAEKTKSKDAEPKEKRSRRISKREIALRFEDLWKLVHEVEPNLMAALAARDERAKRGKRSELLAHVWDAEVVRLAERLGMAWTFYRSSGFDFMRQSSVGPLLSELRAIRKQLLWHRWMRRTDERDSNAWADACAWVDADTSEYEAELLRTLSMSAPQCDGEPTDDYVARLRMIRSALARTPAE